MRIHIIIFLLSLLLPSAVSADMVEDQVGRMVNVPVDPARIVSLAPNITEIVYYLGQEKRLVGATQYSNYPPAAELLPRVGSYIRLDVEKIVALEPGLCLGIKDGNPEHTVRQIEELGIPVYVIDPKNLDDIIDVVRRFGVLLQAVPKSEALAVDLRQRIDRVRRQVATTRTRPRVFFQIDAAPMITAGKDTFINELISTAGGINTAAGQSSYPRYNWEEILLLQPEIVIVASMAGGHSDEELKSGWLRWPQIPAVSNKRIHVLDANLIDRPTPRLIEGLEAMVRIIHPELFERPDEK